MKGWLRQAADVVEAEEKAEYLGMKNAYIHCKQLLERMSSYSPSNKCRIVRLEDMEYVLNGLIEYYERRIEK